MHLLFVKIELSVSWSQIPWQIKQIQQEQLSFKNRPITIGNKVRAQ